MLEVQSISLHYGGNRVLQSVSFDGESGSVVGLVGPNGAGKTSLMNVLTGVIKQDAGEVRLFDRPVENLSAPARAQMGLARTYQIVHPLRRMTVLENVMVGALYGRAQRRSLAVAREKGLEQLERVGLSHRAHVPATSISSGQQKLMDLARALCMDPSIIMMDEPLAALTSENQDLVLQIVKEEARNGACVVLVEHVMRAVTAVSDKVIVLDRGSVIAQGTATEVLQRTDVIEAYLGSVERETRREAPR